MELILRQPSRGSVELKWHNVILRMIVMVKQDNAKS